MAQKLYKNNTPYLDGIFANFQAPLDDRQVLDSIEALYISESTKDDAPLYGVAYKGMQVTVFNGTEPVEMLLNDATPYSLGHISDISAGNYLTYWTIVGKDVRDYVNNTLVPNINSSVNRLDSSVNKIETYVSSTNVSNASNGATTITATAGTTGKTYTVSVNVDGDTVKKVDDKVTAGKYKITKLSTATDGYLSSYKLSYKAPDSSDYTDLDGAIDIPKDYVLKEVHVCKASYSEGTYTETHKQGDEGWDDDTNPVYLHFLWQTKDSTTTTSESYVKVSDMISTDIAGTVARVSALESYTLDTSTRFHDYVVTNDSSVTYLKTYTLDTSTRFHNYSVATDSSIKNIDSSINVLESTIGSTNLKFNGGDSPDTLKTLTAHGNLPKDTSIAALETMTISDIFKAILFETAAPKKISGTPAFTIKWKSGSAYSTTVDVGRTLPTSDTDLDVNYTPEKWQWVSANDATIKGAEVALSVKGTTTFYKASSNTTSGGSTTWTGNIVEGTNGYWYATTTQTDGSYAVDSLGSTTDKNGTIYAAPKHDTLTSSNTINVVGAWKTYSNATNIYEDASTAWSNRTLTGVVIKAKTIKDVYNKFITGSTTLYAQWPQCSASDEMHFYVPNTYKINSVKLANDAATNTFEGAATATLQATTATINNGYTNGTFKDYLISHGDGTTTVQINIVKA